MRLLGARSCTAEPRTPERDRSIGQLRRSDKQNGSVMIRIELNDLATPTLASLDAKVGNKNRIGLMRVLGRTAEREYRGWFTTRDKEGNKRGWSRKHFWARIRRATAYVPSATTDTEAMVSISDPAFRMKVRGGKILPKKAKMLAIPMNEEAYQAGLPSAGLIPGLGLLSLIKGKGSGPNLYLGRHEVGGGLVLYFRLVPQVTVPADPMALPARAAVAAAIEDQADAYIRRNTT